MTKVLFQGLVKHEGLLFMNIHYHTGSKNPLNWICDRKRRTDLGINSPYVFATKCGKEYSLSAHLLLIVLYFILNSDQNDCFLFSVHA